MRNLIVSLALVICSTVVHAQTTELVPNNIRADNTLHRLGELSQGSGASALASNSLIGIPVPPGEAVGNVYLNEDWKKTNLILVNSEKLYEGYLCRYNLLSEQIEIKSADKVSAIESSKVKSFVWMDYKTEIPVFYVSASEYTIKGIKQKGFLTVLTDGKIPLVKKPVLITRKPDYKHEFNTGSRDIKFSIKETYYYVKNGTLVEVKSINNKKLREIFGNDASEMIEFAEKTNNKGKSEVALIMLFDHYNRKFSIN